MAKNLTDIIIAGAGIGGLTSALIFRDAGFNVKVFEAAPEPKYVGAGLALTANAIKIYRRLGLEEKVLALSLPISTGLILTESGQLLSKMNLRKINKRSGAYNAVVHRAALHKLLEETLGSNYITYHSRIASWRETTDKVVIRTEDGKEQQADLLIAADGLRSVIRQEIFPKSKPRYSGYTCWRGVADFTHPKFDTGRTSESWGCGTRFGIAPLPGGQVYWFAVLNAKEGESKIETDLKASLIDKFGHYHFPAKELIMATPEGRIIWSDLYDLNPIKRFYKGRVVLLGDAAHASTPNLGQGAAMAAEDGAVLCSCLVKNRDLTDGLKKYSRLRRPRTSKVILQSRRIGSVGQLSNPFLCKLRNILFKKLFGQKRAEKSMKWLLKFEL